MLRLHCEINEKPFDFPFKESVHGAETVSYAEEKRRRRVNKTISCHYNSVWVLFLFCAEEPVLVGNDLRQLLLRAR